MAQYLDTRRGCPDCEKKGGLSYEVIPPSIRLHKGEEGGEITDHFPCTRDYHCRNCDCEFTLTFWEASR